MRVRLGSGTQRVHQKSDGYNVIFWVSPLTSTVQNSTNRVIKGRDVVNDFHYVHPPLVHSGRRVFIDFYGRVETHSEPDKKGPAVYVSPHPGPEHPYRFIKEPFIRVK